MLSVVAHILAVLGWAASRLSSRPALVLENLALRQQLAVLRRQAPHPKLRRLDRLFWMVLARVWPRWREALLIMKPQTVIA